MTTLDPSDRQALILAIANREGTARELANKFGVSVRFLKSFVEQHREAIELARTLTHTKEASKELALLAQEATSLAELWISEKHKRIMVYQAVAERLYVLVMEGVTDPTVLRELRSYLMAVANELGQLLHRGQGDTGNGDSVNFIIEGVDTDVLR